MATNKLLEGKVEELGFITTEGYEFMLEIARQAVPDHDVQWLHGPNDRVPDCVLSDRYAFSWGGTPPESTEQWAEDAWGVDFVEEFSDGEFTVVCRA